MVLKIINGICIRIGDGVGITGGQATDDPPVRLLDGDGAIIHLVSIIGKNGITLDVKIVAHLIHGDLPL
jgi:hypothetical protein